jgi:hypothetical protein
MRGAVQESLVPVAPVEQADHALVLDPSYQQAGRRILHGAIDRPGPHERHVLPVADLISAGRETLSTVIE